MGLALNTMRNICKVVERSMYDVYTMKGKGTEKWGVCYTQTYLDTYLGAVFLPAWFPDDIPPRAFLNIY